MQYSIKPLLLSKQACNKGQMTYLVDWGKEIWIATVFWYIQADGKHILVDSGISSEDRQRYLYGRPYEHVRSFEEALGSVGITPADVDIIIHTHLHFDHCGHSKLCKNATVIVQEDELKFAYSPHALFFGSYNLEYLKDLHINTVRGDVEILPGIKTIFAPGHSPGTQAVAVETGKGTAVITGFCSIKDNFYPPEKMRTRWPVLAPGVSVNSLQAFDSALRVKGMADIIIPMHDVETGEMDSIP